MSDMITYSIIVNVVSYLHLSVIIILKVGDALASFPRPPQPFSLHDKICMGHCMGVYAHK